MYFGFPNVSGFFWPGGGGIPGKTLNIFGNYCKTGLPSRACRDNSPHRIGSWVGFAKQPKLRYCPKEPQLGYLSTVFSGFAAFSPMGLKKFQKSWNVAQTEKYLEKDCTLLVVLCPVLDVSLICEWIGTGSDGNMVVALYHGLCIQHQC